MSNLIKPNHWTQYDPSQPDKHVYKIDINRPRRWANFHGKTALSIVPVYINCVKCNALQDSGATCSIISTALMRALGLSGTKTNTRISGLGDKTMAPAVEVGVTLRDVDGKKSYDVKLKALPNPCGNMKPINWNEVKHRFPHMADIQFPQPAAMGVDLILGQDLHRLIEPLKIITVNDDRQPYCAKTRLGWTCMGPVPAEERAHLAQTEARLYEYGTHLNAQEEGEKSREETGSDAEIELLDNELQVEVEELVRQALFRDTIDGDNFKTKELSRDDKHAIEIMDAGMKHLDDGRYEVPVLFKSEPNLPPSYEYALKRLKNVEMSKTWQRPEVREHYDKTIKGWQEAGYTETLTEVPKGMHWFLPIFPVVRMDKETTKVRPVIDGRAVIQGKSLNHYVYPGPNYINDLAKVLIGFRQNPVAVSGDVEQMFLTGLSPRKSARFSLLFVAQ